MQLSEGRTAARRERTSDARPRPTRNVGLAVTITADPTSPGGYASLSVRVAISPTGPTGARPNVNDVLLTYVDESYTAERYYIAALVVPEDAAASIIAGLDKVVEDTSWSHGGLASNAELHGYDIVSGKGDWERLAPKVRVRIGVYNRALQVIADHDVKIIVRCVDKVGLDARHPNGHDHPHSVVLTHLLERVDRLTEQMGERAIMIADEVDGQDGYRRDLWQYQR